jgi:hypothetical protein
MHSGTVGRILSPLLGAFLLLPPSSSLSRACLLAAFNYISCRVSSSSRLSFFSSHLNLYFNTLTGKVHSAHAYTLLEAILRFTLFTSFDSSFSNCTLHIALCQKLFPAHQACHSWATLAIYPREILLAVFEDWLILMVCRLPSPQSPANRIVF